MLTPPDHDRIATLRRPLDRARYATGRALLRLLVAGETGVPPDELVVETRCATCGSGSHGRPRVVPPAAQRAVHASISHSGRWVLVAVARVEVGVDVEPGDRTEFDGFDAVALSEAERDELAILPPGSRAAARTQAWVRKEALLKLNGVGLGVEPSNMHVGLSPADRVLADPLDARRSVAIRDLPLDADHRAAVAIRGSQLPRISFVPCAQLLATTEVVLPGSIE